MMKWYKYPSQQDWPELAKRPVADSKAIEETVSNILARVKAGGDKAIRNYTKEFDGTWIDELAVSEQEIENAGSLVSNELKAAIQQAKQNIEIFHKAQLPEDKVIETAP